MKIYHLFLILVLMMPCITVNATQDDFELEISTDDLYGADASTMPEKPATFAGGDAAMYKWLGQNIRYPAAAAEKGIQARVMVRFIVEKDGSITNAKIVKGADPDLDREALRVVNAMPKFTPAEANGNPVRCYFNIPITFRCR